MRTPERLETRRLVIRPFNDSDFKSFSLLIKDELIFKNYDLATDQQTTKREKSIFSSIRSSYNSTRPIFVWAISNKENEDFIGTCGLKSLKDDKTAECFYALLPEYRKNGFAIESMLKILEFSFEELKIAKIIIYIYPNNTPAWKVAERIGMKYMGHIKHKNIGPKAMLFSIEKKEYRVQRFN